MNLRNGKIGIIDLSTGESSEEDLAQDIGAGNVSEGLISRHGPRIDLFSERGCLL